MPSTSTCPKCSEPVTVPDGLAESATVRCPQCDAEYPADDVPEATSDSDAGDLPAELVPVEVDSADVEPDKTGATLKVQCPCCDAKFGLAEVIVAATGERLGNEASAAIGPDGSVVSGGDKSDGLPSFGAPGEDHAAYGIAIDTGEDPQPSAPAAFAFQDEEADRHDAALAGAATTGSVRRKREGEKNPLRMMAEVVLGGVAGLAITYYGLNFFGGERFAYFDIYLPGVAHTVEHRPGWWPGSSDVPDAGEADAEPAAEPSVPEPKRDVAAVDRQNEPGNNLLPNNEKPGEPPMDPPAPIEEPAEEPNEKPSEDAAEVPKDEPPPPPEVGPADPPSFASDELGRILKTAHTAFSADGLTDDSYAGLCRLAQTVTFVDTDGGGPKLRDRLVAVDSLLKRIARDEINLVKIGELANAWASDTGRPDDGILLAGTVESTLELGEAHGTSVKLTGMDRSLVVVSKEPTPAEVGDRVLVLGSVVDKPAENMVGVDTSMRRAVWSRMTVVVGK